MTARDVRRDGLREAAARVLIGHVEARISNLPVCGCDAVAYSHQRACPLRQAVTALVHEIQARDPEAVTRALAEMYCRVSAHAHGGEPCDAAIIFVRHDCRDLASVLASLPDDRLAEADDDSVCRMKNHGPRLDAAHAALYAMKRQNERLEAKVGRVEALADEWDAKLRREFVLSDDDPKWTDRHSRELRAALSGGDAP